MQFSIYCKNDMMVSLMKTCYFVTKWRHVMVFIHVTAICASHQRTNTHLHTTDRQIEYQSCIIQINR